MKRVQLTKSELAVLEVNPCPECDGVDLKVLQDNLTTKSGFCYWVECPCGKIGMYAPDVEGALQAWVDELNSDRVTNK